MPVTVIMIRITVAGILFYHGRKTVHSCRSITSVCRPEKSNLKNVGRWVGICRNPTHLPACTAYPGRLPFPENRQRPTDKSPKESQCTIISA